MSKLVAGNWKMFGDINMISEIKKIDQHCNEIDCEVAICPPFPLLFSANEQTKNILNSAPKISDYISKESKIHFENLLRTLDAKNIKYAKDDNLVRGLDYYNRTVFEYIDTKSNTQNTICAGGRYDFLFENLCDKKIPALGFAIGIERLMEYSGYTDKENQLVNFYIIILDKENYLYSQNISNLIKNISKKFIVSTSYNYNNIKSQLKKADKLSADYCVIIGAEESRNNECQLKSMNSGHQKNININALEAYIKDNIL